MIRVWKETRFQFRKFVNDYLTEYLKNLLKTNSIRFEVKKVEFPGHKYSIFITCELESDIICSENCTIRIGYKDNKETWNKFKEQVFEILSDHFVPNRHDIDYYGKYHFDGNLVKVHGFEVEYSFIDYLDGDHGDNSECQYVRVLSQLRSQTGIKICDSMIDVDSDENRATEWNNNADMGEIGDLNPYDIHLKEGEMIKGGSRQEG